MANRSKIKVTPWVSGDEGPDSTVVSPPASYSSPPKRNGLSSAKDVRGKRPLTPRACWSAGGDDVQVDENSSIYLETSMKAEDTNNRNLLRTVKSSPPRVDNSWVEDADPNNGGIENGTDSSVGDLLVSDDKVKSNGGFINDEEWCETRMSFKNGQSCTTNSEINNKKQVLSPAEEPSKIGDNSNKEKLSLNSLSDNRKKNSMSDSVEETDTYQNNIATNNEIEEEPSCSSDSHSDTEDQRRKIEGIWDVIDNNGNDGGRLTRGSEGYQDDIDNKPDDFNEGGNSQFTTQSVSGVSDADYELRRNTLFSLGTTLNGETFPRAFSPGRRRSELIVHYHEGRTRVKILIIIFWAVYLVLIPGAQVSMVAVFGLGACKEKEMVPIYLLVAGVTGLIEGIVVGLRVLGMERLNQGRFEKLDMNTSQKVVEYIWVLGLIFLLFWSIAGAYWILMLLRRGYMKDGVWISEDPDFKYCDPYLYAFAIWCIAVNFFSPLMFGLFLILIAICGGISKHCQRRWIDKREAHYNEGFGED